MLNYLHLLKDIMTAGEDRGDRTGTGTRSIFGTRLEFDLRDGFPAVTTKKLAFRAVMGELLWFLNGRTDLASLRKYTFGSADVDKKTIWDDNQFDFVKRRNQARLEGVDDDCGDIYGKLWHKDNQFWNAIRELNENPNSRRIMVNTWIPSIVNDPMRVALPPCHYGFQFYVRRGEYLDLSWNQRSVDAFLGLPFNIASYAALVHIVCMMLPHLKPGRVIFNGGDTHIYQDHLDAVEKQLRRFPLAPPEFVCHRETPKEDSSLMFWLHSLKASDFELKNYAHHEPIKARMSV